MRRVPSVLGVVLLLLASALPALAAAPPSPAPAAGLEGTQVGTSLTWHLRDGSRVHLHETRQAHARAPIAPYRGTPPMLYHGGPVVPAEHAVSIYWSSSTIYAGGPTPGTTGVGSADGSNVGYFLNHLGGSSYYNINTTYSDLGGHTVANALSYTGYWADNASPPSGSQNVSDAAIQSEIVSGFTSGKIAYDPATVYAVYSSGSVNLGGGAFSQYCAYHGAFTWNGNTVLYAVMPYDQASPSSCSWGLSPNGDPAADSEVNTLAHELEEANTDPQLNAWYDSSGYENGDECAWIFGTASLSGGQANITVGAKNFEVQENWLNVTNGGQCLQGYSSAPPTKPGAPTLNSATAGVNSVSLGWSAPASNGGAPISGYSIYRSTTAGGEGTTAYATIGNVTSWTDSGAAAGSTYYYKVAATNSAGTGAQSNERSATPLATATLPGASTLTAARSSRRGVQLTWTAAAPNGSAISGYTIYRATSSGGTFTALTTRSGTTTSYRDSATTSGATYWYYIVARNAAGPGPASNTASAVAR